MNLKAKLEREYKKACKDNYKNRDCFKLAMLFCEKFPKFKVSDGFPNWLLADNFELFYEISATANFDNETFVLAYLNFIEEAINLGINKNYIFDIIEGLTTFLKLDKNKLKPLTKQYYNEYLTKRSSK